MLIDGHQLMRDHKQTSNHIIFKVVVEDVVDDKEVVKVIDVVVEIQIQ